VPVTFLAMRPWRWLPALVPALLACDGHPARRHDTVLFASGADLQSSNPLFTVHPLARQVQRYVLLTTLVRYDSLLQVEPYLARRWEWSPDRRRLTLTLFSGLRWHDGEPTTAHDAAWTLDRARDPASGYPRHPDLAVLRTITAADDTTLILTFQLPLLRIPDVLTDLAILPRHRFAGLSPERLRESPWNQHPVGNGPFRFVRHEANRRWVFERSDGFPDALGGPPVLARLVIAVVDEPLTKLAALTSGELDAAGIQPAHADYVRQDPALRVVDYPLLFSTVILFNARRRVFAASAARLAVATALDREALVEGAVYGFGTPAEGPIPPELPVAPRPPASRSAPATAAAGSLRFELLTVGSGEAAIEQLIQSQLARSGIRIEIRQLELSAFLDRVYGPGHDFDAALLGVPGDPQLGHLGPLAALSGLTPPGELGQLIDFFGDSVPATFLYHARGLQGLTRRLTGIELGLRGELATVTRWRLDPP
jgi:peptide/nickel transport system substrate-binding protein